MSVAEEEDNAHAELHVIEEHLAVVCPVPEYETNQQRADEMVEHLDL